MKRMPIRIVAVAVLTLTAAWSMAGGKETLPPAVAKAVEANQPGAEIEKTDVENQGGITVYDIEFKGGRGEMEVAADGTVLDVAVVVEMKDIPEAAAAALRKAAGTRGIKQLEKSEVRARIEKDGGKGRLSTLATPETVYEAELAKGGEIEVAADGRLVKAPKSVGKSSEK